MYTNPKAQYGMESWGLNTAGIPDTHRNLQSVPPTQAHGLWNPTGI